MKSLPVWMLAVLLLICGRAAAAQSVSVLGSPSFTISNAVAGFEPAPASDNTSSYSVTTPPANRTYNITARINTAMPAGTTLTATFIAPPGATSVGPVALTTTDQNVVTAVPRRLTAETQGITYQFVATVDAGVIATSNRTVTLTIVQAP